MRTYPPRNPGDTREFISALQIPLFYWTVWRIWRVPVLKERVIVKNILKERGLFSGK